MFAFSRWRSGRTLLIAAALAGPALGQGNESVETRLQALQEKVEAQEAELAKLRAAQAPPAAAPAGGSVHQEEVSAIVKEVLSDANTRSSLQQNSLAAGYNRGFFLGTEDGKNLLRFNLSSQFRYLYNHRQDAPTTPAGVDRDLDENGFQLRTLNLNFQGHAFDPVWTYRLRLAADTADGTVRPDWAYIGYALTPNLNLQAGQFAVPFLREELIGADRQLTAERSYTNDYFTADYSQGLVLNYWKDRLNLYGSLHDGSYGWRTDFQGDRGTVAVAGRAEYIVIGEPSVYRQKGWRNLSDFTSWAGEPVTVLVGGAVDYELGEEGQTTFTPDALKWTADVSGEFGGTNAFAAVTGQHFDANRSGTGGGLPGGLDGADQIGLVVQGGFFVVTDRVELFSRYEWIYFDGVYYRNNAGSIQGRSRNLTDDELGIVTFGVNYYFLKHNAKLTADVLWAMDPVPVENAGQGLLESPQGDQLALRLQLTFGF